MRIAILPTPEAGVIAREDQLGHFEGRFVESDDGSVWYHHPWDARAWFAGDNATAFRLAAVAWNQYCDECANCKDYDRSEAALRLRETLSRIAVLEDLPNNFWIVLIEQVAAELL